MHFSTTAFLLFVSTSSSSSTHSNTFGLLVRSDVFCTTIIYCQTRCSRLHSHMTSGAHYSVQTNNVIEPHPHQEAVLQQRLTKSITKKGEGELVVDGGNAPYGSNEDEGQSSFAPKLSSLLVRNDNQEDIMHPSPTPSPGNKRNNDVETTISWKEVAHHDVDAGILRPRHHRAMNVFASNGADNTPLPFTPCADSVMCINGIEKDTGKTCEEACGGECCVGNFACKYFTGRVCRDGSCSGFAACWRANITIVENGSCNGTRACQTATIPFVLSSCKGGDYSCAGVAEFDSGFVAGGSIGGLNKSCHGREACNKAAYWGTSAGNVGVLNDSCIGERACYYIGGYGGSVGNMNNSCKGQNACRAAASWYGNLGDINDSCNGHYACSFAARDYGNLGNINDSCNGQYACGSTAWSYGNLGAITQSCNADSACKNLASERGSDY